MTLCPESRRVQSIPKVGLSDALDLIPNYNDIPEIAIDGVCGTGKTTLLNGSNRMVVKINNVTPDISQGSSYNIAPHHTLLYALNHLVVNPKCVIWDRSPFSNLAWQLINPLMATFKDVSNFRDLTYEKCYDQMYTLASYVSYKETLETICDIKKIPTLFLINTNYPKMIEILNKRAIERESLNDALYCQNARYCILQSIVYKFTAQILGMPCFDIGPHLDHYTIADISTNLLRKITYTGPLEPDTCIEQIPIPEYAKYSANTSYNLMYIESKK